MVIKNSIITKNTASDGGGGIYGRGKVRVENTIITQNSAIDSSGGGIYSKGVLEIVDSVISRNEASYGGGGISANLGIVSHSNITGNKAMWGGGLLGSDYSKDSKLDVSDSLIADNVASIDGGGISSYRSNIVKTSIIHNKAFNSGGGIYQDGVDWGYGLGRITDSIIEGNSAVYGGGIYTAGTMFYLEGLTILNNNARAGGGIYNDNGGTLNIRNTEIQHNNAWYKGGGIYNKNLIYIDKITQIINNWRHNSDGQPLKRIDTREIIKSTLMS